MASDTAETIINILATIATACLFLSMIPGMYTVHKKRSTTGINFYPLAMMFGQSMGWVIYSFADHSFFPVGAVNSLGAVLGVVFSAIFILHEKDRRVRYSIFFCGVFALVIALLLYRFLGTQDDDKIAKVLGYFADVLAIIMFGAPLILMGDVIKTKNSEIIAAPMAVSGFINGSLWSALDARGEEEAADSANGFLLRVRVRVIPSEAGHLRDLRLTYQRLTRLCHPSSRQA
ncbi:hypothetical protein PF008_g28952 [Phytophthora fragariae]|uniref:Bidirectional sugar transporter SWEET n=1 Tax=Phytophthora fragariae TaxID=53985 RepID=A0A6G0QAM5_9STRA|nr:hypothetical protein PF008_g28952 [Phytophthora fragariae]